MASPPPGEEDLGGGQRVHIFIFPLLPQKKELSDYKCRIKVKSTKI